MTVPPVSKKEDLSEAISLLNRSLKRDEEYPPLGDAIQVLQPDEFRRTPPGLPDTLTINRVVTIPDALFEQYDLMASRCFMGLLPEISRAWISIDTRLFLWNYSGDSPDDFQTFDELDQIIVSVGLVSPVPGLFLEDISYILVIATALDIILLGVGRSPSGDIELYRTEMSVRVHGSLFTSIIGTASGRILLLSTLGKIHELCYKPPAPSFYYNSPLSPRWLFQHSNYYLRDLTTTALHHYLPSFSITDYIFAREKYLHIAIDSSRNILYATTESMRLHSFSLSSADGSLLPGADLNILSRRSSSASSSSTSYTSSSAFPSSSIGSGRDEDPDISVISLNPIPIGCKGVIVLVITLSNGEKCFYQGGFANAEGDASRFSLRYFASRRSSPKNHGGRSHCALYSRGVSIVAAPRDDDSDILHCTSLDPVPLTLTNEGRRTTELLEERILTGRVWNISESLNLLNPILAHHVPPALTTFIDRPSILDNELYTQYQYPPRQFTILTNLGIGFLEKRRPVDQLISLLSDPYAQNAHFDEFAHIFGSTETAAMCVAILCGHFTAKALTSQSAAVASSIARAPALADRAREALALIADKPASDHSSLPNPATASAAAATADSGSSPSVPTYLSGGASAVILAPPPAGSGLTARHEGIALYLSRILRPIWHQNISSLCIPGKEEGRPTERLIFAVLRPVQDQLTALDQFLQSSAIAHHEQVTPASSALTDKWEKEGRSIKELRNVIRLAHESISFLLFLIDNRVSDIVDKSSQAVKDEFAALLFHTFATDEAKGFHIRTELAKSLISLMGQGGGIGMSQRVQVDSVSESLSQYCPYFYAQDKLGLIKANEHFLQGMACAVDSEREYHFGVALNHFLQQIDQLDVDDLPRITEGFNDKGFQRGSIELALRMATHLHSTIPASAQVDACYSLATKALTPWVCPKDTPPEEMEPERAAYGLHLISGVIAHSTYPFHEYLFSWLQSTRGLPFLLSLGPTPSLEAYLQSDPTSLDMLNLLWQYYARQELFIKAAQIQDSIASNPRLPLRLGERVEYLSRAIGSARASMNLAGEEESPSALWGSSASHGPGSTGEASNRLASSLEALAVAQVQLSLFEELTSDPSCAAALVQGDERLLKGIDHLNHHLLDLTTQLQEYAWPYNLYESCILIFNAADAPCDPKAVLSVWERYAETTFASTSGGGGDPFAHFAERVHRLGTRIYPSPTAFPTHALFALLTRRVIKLGVSSGRGGWPVETLLGSGVRYDEVYSIITGAAGERAWQGANEASFLLYSLIVLLERWLEATPVDSRHLQGYLHQSSGVKAVLDRMVGQQSSRFQGPMKERATRCSAKLAKLH